MQKIKNVCIYILYGQLTHVFHYLVVVVNFELLQLKIFATIERYFATMVETIDLMSRTR